MQGVDNKKIISQTILIIVGMGLLFVLGANMGLFESFGITGENFNTGQFIVTVFLITMLVSVILIILKEALNVEINPLRIGISSFTALYLTFLFRKPVLPSPEKMAKLMGLEQVSTAEAVLVIGIFFLINIALSVAVYEGMISKKRSVLIGVGLNFLYFVFLVWRGLSYIIITAMVGFIDLTLLFIYLIPGAVVWGFIFHFTEAGSLILGTELSGSSVIVNAVYLSITFPVFYIATVLYLNILKWAFKWASQEENKRKVANTVKQGLPDEVNKFFELK